MRLVKRPAGQDTSSSGEPTPAHEPEDDVANAMYAAKEEHGLTAAFAIDLEVARAAAENECREAGAEGRQTSAAGWWRCSRRPASG